MDNFAFKLTAIALLSLSIQFKSYCQDDKIIIYSDSRYKPLPKVDVNYYRSVQLRPNQNKDNAVGLSISGGGSRAQYFGLGVLIGLDEIKKDNSSFLNEIDYFSTVSGGGYAAGYYLALIKNKVLDSYPSFLDFWKSNLRKDTLQEFLYKDANEEAILKLPLYERNDIRESYPTMIDNQLLQLGKRFSDNRLIKRLFLSDFFIPIDSSIPVEMPMFVANGTIYHNGERLPFMPHIIDYLNIDGSLLPPEEFDIQKGFGLPLTYAITGSAAFPGILPMLKLSIKDDENNVIRVIDGGAVDNLGFKTLFELLHSDHVLDSNKKALIVDCGGFGNEIQSQQNTILKLSSLLQKSLLYTVDIPLLYSDENITFITSFYHINRKKVQRIGFSTLKDRFIKMDSVANPQTLRNLEILKGKIKDGSIGWNYLYHDFVSRHKFEGFDVSNISEIPTSSFSKFTLNDTFELFELSAQIETKVKIYPWEKEILVLAGRYAVYLERKNIADLIN